MKSMRKIGRAWTYLVISILLLLGLSSQAQAKNKVKIISVVPDSITVTDAEIEIQVEVEYDLGSKDEGVLNLGFNVQKPRAYVMGKEGLIVKKGHGRVTISGKIKPSEGQGKWTLYAYVNLSENPHSDVWTPLASSKKKIKVKQKK